MVERDGLMGEAQERFNEATNDMDRAYWQGALDGEAAERERIIGILENIRPGSGVMGDDVSLGIQLIKGEK